MVRYSLRRFVSVEIVAKTILSGITFGLSYYPIQFSKNQPRRKGGLECQTLPSMSSEISSLRQEKTSLETDRTIRLESRLESRLERLSIPTPRTIRPTAGASGFGTRDAGTILTVLPRTLFPISRYFLQHRYYTTFSYSIFTIEMPPNRRVRHGAAVPYATSRESDLHLIWPGRTE